MLDNSWSSSDFDKGMKIRPSGVYMDLESTLDLDPVGLHELELGQEPNFTSRKCFSYHKVT
jgi:hypothetical protein